MKTASLALLLACAVIALAQAPGPAPKQGAAKATVVGRVVSAPTSEPLRRAYVGLVRAEAPGGAQTTTTNEQGQFLFKGVDPGRYRVWVNRNGYVRQAYGQRDPGSYADSGGTLLTITPGQEIKDLLFRLQPAGAISGHVADEEGEAVVGAQVQALRWNFFRGRRQLMPAGSANTDDRGDYRIFGLPPGRYYLCAVFEGGEATVLAGASSETDALDEAYAPNFYPGAPDPSEASPVQIRGGDEVPGINFVMTPQRTVHVAGRVLNSITGQPARGVTVQLGPRSSAMRTFLSGDQNATTDEQGNFQFRGVIPGAYALMAELYNRSGGIMGGIVAAPRGEERGGGVGRLIARQLIDVGSAELEGVILVLSAGTDVAGLVRFEGGVGTVKPDRLRVVLEATEDLSIGAPSAPIRPDYTFNIPNLLDDVYRINTVGLPEGGYLKSARMGTQDILEDGLAMTRGRRGPLELVISMSAGRVEGTAVDSGHKPFVNARVVLVPEGAGRKRPALFRQVTADGFGQFSIRSVAPGDYRLFAFDAMEPGAYQDPEFLRPYEDRGQLVHVAEGGQSTAEAEVIVTQPGTQ